MTNLKNGKLNLIYVVVVIFSVLLGALGATAIRGKESGIQIEKISNLEKKVDRHLSIAEIELPKIEGFKKDLKYINEKLDYIIDKIDKQRK